MQRVPLEFHEDVVLPARMQDSPALHFPRAHGDGRLAHAIDGQESCGGFREECLEIFDRPKRVEYRLGQYKQALLRVDDLGNILEVTLDDQRANCSAGNLDVSRKVVSSALFTERRTSGSTNGAPGMNSFQASGVSAGALCICSAARASPLPDIPENLGARSDVPTAPVAVKNTRRDNDG